MKARESCGVLHGAYTTNAMKRYDTASRYEPRGPLHLLPLTLQVQAPNSSNGSIVAADIFVGLSPLECRSFMRTDLLHVAARASGATWRHVLCLM